MKARFSVRRAWCGVGSILILFAGACGPEDAATESNDSEPSPTAVAPPDERPLRVFVSIPPQKFLTERVGGQHVDVSVLLPPGQSPATYELTPKRMVQLAEADVYFRTGVPFEAQLLTKVAAALKNLRVVDTCEGLELRPMPEHGGDDHGHEAGSDHHHHGERDPHVWMNPQLAKVQGRIICQELCRLDSARASDYEANTRALEAELDKVDASIAAMLTPLRGREFYVFHPAYGYFADAYGLEQVAVETGGKDPTAKRLGALIERARKSGVKDVFVQPQFASTSADAVADALGGSAVPLDPLAEDYISNLLEVASKIKAALTSSTQDKPENAKP
jgi:zinc transport system substrate-binding protein